MSLKQSAKMKLLREFLAFQLIFVGLRVRKPLLHANNKGADQPVLSHSLISTYVIHTLDTLDLENKAFQFSS